MSTTHFLSIDIESVGDRFDHSVIAIGACFGPVDGSWPRDRLVKFRGNLKPLPGDSQDPLCMIEFWSKNQEVYQEIVNAAEDAHVVMTRFLTFCQQVVAEYEDNPGVRGGKIKLVTDSPDFDLGRLHYLGEVATKTWPTPIRNLGKPGARHGQADPGERLDALGLWDACDAWMTKNVPGVVHDHRPDHDAEHSYWQMVFLHRRGEDLSL
jgi:hypothetical protein